MTTIRKTFLFSLSLLSFTTFAQTFQKTYHVPFNNDAAAVIEVSGGGYLIAGTTNTTTMIYDGLLMRVSADGTQLWSKTYGGTGSEAFSSIVETSDGYIAAGDLSSVPAAGDDIYVVKVDFNGNLIWSKRIGIAGYTNRSRSMALIPDGSGVVVSGYSYTTPTTTVTSLFRLDMNGNQIWGRTYNSITTNLFQSNYIKGDTIFASGDADYAAAFSKISLADGNVYFTRIYDGNNQEGLYWQTPAPDGNLVLSGLTKSSDSGNNQDMWAQKINEYGQALWSYAYARPGHNLRGKTINTADGGLLLLPRDEGYNPASDAIIGKTDANGSLLWSFNYGGPQTDDLADVIQTSDGGFLAVGSTRSFTSDGFTDILLIKTDANGQVANCCIRPGGLQAWDMDVAFLSADYGAGIPFSPEIFPTTVTNFGFTPHDFCGYASVTTVPVDITLCPGQSYTLHGIDYQAPATINDTLPSNTGCDSIVVYTLIAAPYQYQNHTESLCPGQTFLINGVPYSAPATIQDTVIGYPGECPTIHTYNLLVKTATILNQTISFCPGESVTLGGQTYTQSGTVQLTLAGQNGQCDTLATYTLVKLTQPTIAKTISFCPGESVTLGGQTYTQPGTVQITLPATSGCDTLATYTLQYATPAPSTVGITCPANISVDANNSGGVPVSYNDPTAASDCLCPGMTLTRTGGPASGSTFPVGITQVCYNALDACGNSKSCCFSVAVNEEGPCDIKVVGCVKYELLSITSDLQKNYTYRIRVTNNCSNKLIYTAIQLPGNLTANSPTNASGYTSPDGRAYQVHNPNFSPFYSIRFKSGIDSIANGQSDIFKYTLPAQADVDYIHITSRLATQNFYEAYLNTFYCPIGVTPDDIQAGEREDAAHTGVHFYPNPSDGMLWMEAAAFSSEDATLSIYDVNGKKVFQTSLPVSHEPMLVRLPETMANGLYFLNVTGADSAGSVQKFLLHR